MMYVTTVTATNRTAAHMRRRIRYWSTVRDLNGCFV
jgi:hypothetical protein